MVNWENVPEYIVQFYEDNKKLEISFDEFIKTHTNCYNIHNHTIANLYLYFRLDYYLEKQRVVCFPGCIWIIDNRKYKFFVSDVDILQYFNFDSILSEFYKKFIFYSSIEQTNCDIMVMSKLKEMNYNLEELIGDPEHYVFWKKYVEKDPDVKSSKVKKRIDEYLYRPIKKIEGWKEEGRLHIRDYREEDHEVMEDVHSQWCEAKLNNPNTFKMMFSSGRYNKCLRKMYILGREKFFAKIIYFDNVPVACVQAMLDGEHAYGIGFFSLYEKTPSQFTQMLFSWYLRELYEVHGIKHLHYGMEVDKNLHNWKAHYPYHYSITYKYNFIKK